MVQNGSNSPHDARREIERIPLDSDMMAALQDPAHPGHKAASARRRELYESAYSDADTPVVVDDDPSLRSNDRTFLAPPPDPKEYRFDPAPPGVPYDAALEQKARGWFHKAGVPQWLARNVAREWNRTVENPPDVERIASDAATTEKSLRRQWGDQYDVKIEAARSLIRSFKNDEMTDLLDRSGLANSEYLIRQLAALAAGRAAK
jgi:hypothetical protein